MHHIYLGKLIKNTDSWPFHAYMRNLHNFFICLVNDDINDFINDFINDDIDDLINDDINDRPLIKILANCLIDNKINFFVDDF